jgi:hypothetical protein
MKCECNTTLCAEHQQSFLDILADIPGRLSTMNVSIMKQAVMGGQGGKPTNDDDRPLPINIGAAEAQKALMVVLAETTRRVRHCLPEGTCPSYPGIPTWLAGLMPRMVQHPESVDWYHDIRNAYEKAGQAIDLPAERVRAGRCHDCNNVLYAVVGNEKVRCRPCLRSYDVETLRAEEINRVRAYRGTATEVLRVLEHAGIKIKLKKITSWAEHNQVTYSLVDGVKHYTVGDVHDVYNEKRGSGVTS